MEIEIKVNITPQQYIRLDNMARRIRRPMDKALGWMVTHHMDSILENTHISAPAGPKALCDISGGQRISVGFFQDA